ncbi:MAG: hypothetical protein KGH72_00945 [Candidatus Micrarchaeota archaeon]|nr:hypothetical protein [Candidatus Micrarchaeota archaeon]
MSEQNNMERKMIAVRSEHAAWVAMFKEIGKTFNISDEELNNIKKYRPMFSAIEKWGIEYFKSMKAQGVEAWQAKGLFQDDPSITATNDLKVI